MVVVATTVPVLLLLPLRILTPAPLRIAPLAASLTVQVSLYFVTGAFTLTVHFALTEEPLYEAVQVIVAVPAFTAVTFPLEVTVHTFLLLVVHFTEEGVIVFGDTEYFNVTEFPTFSVWLVALREI